MLHINKDLNTNPFLSLYEVSKNKITKKHGDGLWHILKTEDILPDSGSYTIVFDILTSSLNCV